MHHRQQHFVPAFLLREWESGPEKKLMSLWWKLGKVSAKPYKASSVARHEHLYSVRDDLGGFDVSNEVHLMSRQVDAPGALVHQQLIARASLNDIQRTDWARFLVAQLLRVPKKIAEIRSKGSGVIARLEQEALERGEGSIPAREWLAENLSMLTLSDIIKSDVLNGKLVAADWAVIDLSAAAQELLIGDIPIVFYGALGADFILALPLSPSKLFIAFSEEQYFKNLMDRTIDEVVIVVNQSTFEQASDQVFATSNQPLEFLRKHRDTVRLV